MFGRSAVTYTIRLYARPDAISSGSGDYALHITKRLLGFYQDYFKVQYSLPKLELSAVNLDLAVFWAPARLVIDDAPASGLGAPSVVVQGMELLGEK
ncbi:hypothetical protein NQZ68_038263 [Dissostichus eleginoides]|nr:hypothetical protein NQZ68_038263 [Dissostichus eleginoides]